MVQVLSGEIPVPDVSVVESAEPEPQLQPAGGRERRRRRRKR